jgi:hypothetical protein
MTAPKPVRLSAQAVQRIREAAWGWPADQRLADLERQLSKAIYDYHQLSVRHIKAQKTRLKKIHQTASTLADLLRDDEGEGGVDWCSEWPKEFPPPSKFAERIQRMVGESGILEMSPQKIIGEIIPGSELEWLIGIRLPELFEQYFRDAPTASRKGRYADFVAQVLTEFEITNHGRPYSRGTIIRALIRARSDRDRRTHGGQK